jgi:hypothetical protein
VRLEEAEGAFGERGVDVLLTVRAGLAEAADAHHDDVGALAREIGIAESPFFEPARAEVLDHDVALGRELARDGLSLGRAQVERHQAFAAQNAGRVERLALIVPAGSAYRVAVERLDFDDLGAEVREQAPAERARDRRSQLEHAIARKRTLRRRLGHCRASPRSVRISRSSAACPA